MWKDSREFLGKELWDAGVSAEFIQNKENPNFKAQLEEALSKNIPFMVIIGAKEVEEGLVTVKDLQANSETKMSRSEMVTFFLSKTSGANGAGGLSATAPATPAATGGVLSESVSSPGIRAR